MNFQKIRNCIRQKKTRFINALIREMCQVEQNIGEIVIEKVEIINELVKLKHPILFNLAKLNDIWAGIGFIKMELLNNVNKALEWFESEKSESIMNVLNANDKILGSNRT